VSRIFYSSAAKIAIFPETPLVQIGANCAATIFLPKIGRNHPKIVPIPQDFAD
jgi:hypothetical protein